LDQGEVIAARTAASSFATPLAKKPVQPIATTADDRTHIDEFSDAELTALLRAKLKAEAVITSDEERPDDESLN
jgi:hypothetical protein